MIFGEVPITNFALPSSPENADAIRELIKDHDVIFIRNHGSLVVGKDLNDALIHTERLEHICKTLVYAEILGGVNVLPEEILSRIRKEKI
jgi:L-fuculose-phosphate aldolase